MTLVQLQVLLAIIDYGGFTAAAAQLGMTQSAVSRALAALEQELGASLIERGRRAPRMTAIGERVVIHARTAVAAAKAARQESAAGNGLMIGRVRLGSFPTISSQVLSHVLRVFHERYPGVTVVLFEGTGEEVRDWIIEGVVDIGLVTEYDPGLRTVRLQSHPFVAVMALDDPLARQERVSARDLAAVPMILPASGCEHIIRGFFAQDGLPLRPAYTVRDTATVLEMVREGLGITVLSLLSMPKPGAGLCIRPLEPDVIEELALGVPAQRLIAPAVQALMDEAVCLQPGNVALTMGSN
jgi:DNA-binding transcriptional LysR family regulator